MNVNTQDHLEHLAVALARCLDCGKVVRFDIPKARSDYRCPTCRRRALPKGTATVVPSPRPHR